LANASSTATLTVLFTDLANYTGRVSGTDREGLRRILMDHEDAVRPLVEDVGGRIIKNIGDSFLCVFTSATDGLRTALAIHAHELRVQDTETIRLALSTGDVEEIDGDVYGTPVNTAARILELTPAGEAWFSLATRLCINAYEIPWDDVGRFALKGIPEEQDCFRLVPPERVWLPARAETALESRSLIRIGPNEQVPHLPADPTILLEGFAPQSEELKRTLGLLPVLEPQALLLAAHTLSLGERTAWQNAGHGLVIGTPEAIDFKVVQLFEQMRTHAADTFSLDPEDTMIVSRARRADLELMIAGLALPNVPFSEVVNSYSYDLLPDARWVTRSTRAVMRVTVNHTGVEMTAMQPGISIAGAALPAGQAQQLEQSCDIETPMGMFSFVTTTRYAGLILGGSQMHLPVSRGQRAELGRNPGSPGLAFPNRPGQDNIQWCSGERASSARRDGFTLDRVLAGRQQASVEISKDGVKLTPLHKECPTFILRGGKIGQVKKPVRIRVDDMIVAGTTVVGMRTPD
jgi:class 3 adenylate cyclase